MDKTNKYKNIIIKDNIDDNDKKLNIKDKKTICICGKLGTSECIFNSCKKCCNSEKCNKHNTEAKEIKPKICVFCENSAKYKIKNIYFCGSCYNSNKKLIDNITPKNYMFEVNGDECICGSVAPSTCIFKSCRNCCPSKYCARHNKDIIVSGLHNCFICNKMSNINLMNNFYMKSADKIVNYCKKCYKNNRILINNLIYKNATEKDINKFKVKIIETEEEKLAAKKEKENEEKGKKEFEEFKNNISKYKDKILTDKILKQIEKNENFCLNNLILLKPKYKCPICNLIVDFDLARCVECKRFICNVNCSEEKIEKCPNKNCFDCKNSSCENSNSVYYCKDCFVDNNKEFYQKYKNKIVTNEILELENIDLSEFSHSNYNLKFRCQLCDDVLNLCNDFISQCDRCDKNVCIECGIFNYVTCGLPFCEDCDNNCCRNGEKYFFCDECANEMDSYDDISDTDDENNDNKKSKPRCSSPVELANEKTEECDICYINKKKYACIPCGHLCMCGDCANKVDTKCPLCNVEFTSITKIYI